MQPFWEHFLPPYQRYWLFPHGLRHTWEQIQPFRAAPAQMDIWLVVYAISNDYNAPWRELLAGKFPPNYGYRHFSVPKSDGSRRELSEPHAALKALQYKILEKLLTAKPHPAAIGYRKGMSIADHAWAHAGARTLITADIADFFPSTARYRVRQFWREHPKCKSEDSVQLLTNLTTLRGGLPQGAPTSPMLSNLVNRPLDQRLTQVAQAHGAHYTRYADDMVFSWRERARPPSDFEALVRRILAMYGYRLHVQKGWQVWHASDAPLVTGVQLTTDGKVDLPPPMLQRMKALAQSPDAADQLRLAGYEGYRRMIRRR